MDDFSISDESIDCALIELEKINKFLGGNRASIEGLKKIYGYSLPNQLNILDIGGGKSDIFFSLIKNNTNVKLINIDKNFRAAECSQRNNPLLTAVSADAFNLPVKDKSVDISHASLFCHHFNENELTNILAEMNRVSKKAIIINDLRRSLFALIGIRVLTKLFSKSEMVKNDAPLSVKKGFVKSEILSVLSKCGFKNFYISRVWAFRYLIIIYL